MADVKSILGGKDHEKSEKKDSKDSKSPEKHKHKHMHIRPTDNQGYIVEHHGDDSGKAESEHAMSDLDELHDHMEQHYGGENPGESEEAPAGAPAQGAEPQPTAGE